VTAEAGEVGQTPSVTSTPAADLCVEVRSSLANLAPEWDQIAGATPLPSAFCRSWWIDHAAGSTPSIVCCLRGDRLIGGAAFEVETVARGPVRLERIRALGQGVLAPDHIDIVAAVEDADVVLDAVLGWLRRPGNRIVDLDGLAADGRLGRALAAYWIDRTVAPYADLHPVDADPDAPANVDASAYLAGRPGQLRSTVERSRKRLERDGCSIERVPLSHVDAALESLERLHDRRWGEDSNFLDAWDRFAAAARAATDADLWIGEVRTADGEVVATEWDVLTPSSFAFYQSGRSPEREWRGAGSVLRANLIHAAAESGRDQYDLLRGDERYKDDWATDRRWLLRVRFGSGPVGRLAATSAAVWRSVAPVVERLRGRIADRRGPAVSREPAPRPR
jgi:CelD/BcsL family acetyltransferase involved in cellulose biosynthesis